MEKNDRFGKEWSSGSAAQEYPTDIQAQQGLSFLGATPPSFNLHDAMFMANDWKDNWLFDQIKGVTDAYGQTLDLTEAGTRTALADAIAQAINDSLTSAASTADSKIAAHELSRNHPDGTTTAKGFMQFGTSAENLAGTRTDRAAHLAGVHAAFNQFGLGQRALAADLNNLPASSLYYYNADSLNVPMQYGAGISIQRAANEVSQIAIGAIPEELAFRSFTGSQWSGWRYTFHSGNFDPASKADASALIEHSSDYNNPHNVTAAQAGADPAGTASTLVSGHAASRDHPAATTIALGFVEKATLTEAKSGAADKFPDSAGVKSALDDRAATVAQSQTGIANDVFVTPASLGSVALGMGQTWQNLTATRLWNTTYTNTTGRAIVVNFTAYTLDTLEEDWYISVDGKNIALAFTGPVNTGTTLSAVVPNGSEYSVTSNSPASLQLFNWSELR